MKPVDQNHPERRASYVVSAEKTYFVTTITWVNESVGNYGSNESGIRDMTRYRDGMKTPPWEVLRDLIPFTMVNHNIWPIERGHTAVVNALKLGIEPIKIDEYLCPREY